MNNITSKNASDAKKTDNIEVAKKIDDDEDDENKPKETKPIEPISTVIKKKLQRTKHFSGRVTEFIIHLLNVSFVEL